MNSMRLFLVIPALAVMALFVALPFIIGVYVYRDANRRGMNAILWALVAVLAPSLVGFLIYLLVRGNYTDLRCPRCGAPVGEEFVICPRCGAKLRPSCPSCAMPVEPDWRLCPKCAQPLPETQTDICPPVRAKDRSLWKVLAIVLIVPILLLALLFLGMMVMRASGGSASFRAVTVSEYYEKMAEDDKAELAAEVKDWAEHVDFTVRSAYALRYTGSDNQHYFLVYIPSIGRPNRAGFGSSSGIFGTTLKLELNSSSGEIAFLNLASSAKEVPRLKIKIDGKTIPCEVTEVNYNPTLYFLD